MLQQIADEVPDGVVEVRTPDSAYLACDGGGYYSINHWVVTPGPEFDGEAFVDALPARLGDGFVVAEVVDIKSPAVPPSDSRTTTSRTAPLTWCFAAVSRSCQALPRDVRSNREPPTRRLADQAISAEVIARTAIITTTPTVSRIHPGS